YYPFLCLSAFSFLTDPATTVIYTLSLHDALPISLITLAANVMKNGYKVAKGTVDLRTATEHTVLDTAAVGFGGKFGAKLGLAAGDRKSTRLNSSHVKISYAVFCLKKKKKKDKRAK